VIIYIFIQNYLLFPKNISFNPFILDYYQKKAQKVLFSLLSE
jgi:hypothetical protein